MPEIPWKLWPKLKYTLDAFPNETDFSNPHIRPTLHSTYPFILAFYVVVMVLGVILNFMMLFKAINITKVLRERQNYFSEYVFIANVAIQNIMCMLVLPLSLSILLIQNWIFGSTFCSLESFMQVSDLIFYI